MSKYRILIVDDSSLVRRLLTRALSSDPGVEVIGSARNGEEGLARIKDLEPDLVTLDVEMPVMGGLELLAKLRELGQRLPVIVFSSVTQRGAATTLDALALGALDYVPKPGETSGPDQAVEYMKAELLPRVKAFCEQHARIRELSEPVSTPALLAGARRRGEHQPAKVVAIGASTGGPVAIADLLQTLPGRFPAPILVVQHMPSGFTRALAERLSGQLAFTVAEGQAGERIDAGTVWIAPGGHHMFAEQGPAWAKVGINQDPPENSCRPSIDVLFRSVAKVWGSRTLGVVLTGLGADGVGGCKAIRDAGGQVIVQDEASSVAWSMPGNVAKAGLADCIVPLGQMSAEITRRVTAKQARP